MGDDTIYVTNIGRTMYGVAVAGAIAILVSTAVVVIGGGVVLFKLMR